MQQYQQALDAFQRHLGWAWRLDRFGRVAADDGERRN
jgi:hypothetical protein